MKSVAEITNNMAQAIGTQGYTGHHAKRIVYTDGVEQLAFDADCHWLIDAIASYQAKHSKVEFQVWELETNTEKHTAVLTMKEDTGRPDLVKQKIPYTDFPLENVKFYVQLGSIDGVNPALVLMLPSEY